MRISDWSSDVCSSDLAMMTRATLGHTGRALSADRATVAVYLLVASSAVLRLVAALVPGFYAVAIELAGGAWILAFAVFLAAYAPKLCGPRVKDRKSTRLNSSH